MAALVATTLTILALPAASTAAVFNPLLGEQGCQWYDDAPWTSTDHGCSTPLSSVEAEDTWDAVLSADGAHMYIATGRADIRRLDRDPATGALTAGACWTSSDTTGCATIPNLWGPTALELSSDGRQLYVGTDWGGVTVLDRDTTTGNLTGRVAPDACHGAADSGCTLASTGASWVMDLHLSADGTSLYVSQDDEGLYLFQRDLLTGRLTQPAGRDACIGTWTTDDEGNPCHWDGNTWSFEHADTTPDGKFLFAATYESINTYARNPDGTLTRLACLAAWTADGCVDGSSLGLWDVHRLQVSSDGAYLYMIGDGSVVAFSINATTGALTQLPAPSGCFEREDSTYTPACTRLRGFKWGSDFTLSADGTEAFVAGDRGLFLFDRDPATGALTQRPGKLGCITPFADAVAGLSDCDIADGAVASSMLIPSPDGQNLYAIGGYWSAIVTFGNPAAACRDLTRPVQRNDRTLKIDGRCVGLDPELETFELVTPPTHGTISAFDTQRGTFTYTPDPTYAGPDTFSYRSRDGVATTNTATVSLQLRAVTLPTWDAPPAINGSFVANDLHTLDVSGAAPAALITRTAATWSRCDAAGATCTTTVGYAMSYRPTAADIGSRLRASVTAYTLDGSVVATTFVTPVIGDNGQPIFASARIDGSAIEGGTLTDATTWGNVVAPSTNARQWVRCSVNLATCSDIPGATGVTYVAVNADVGSRLRVRSSITDARASVTTTTQPTTYEVRPITWQYPYIYTRPVLNGDALIGSTLTVTDATLTNGVTPTQIDRQWRRCGTDGKACDDIPGATGTSHALTAADDGYRIVVFERVWSGTRYNWSLSASTDQVRSPAQVGTMPPANTGLPGISTPRVGYSVFVDNGTWSGIWAMSFTYQWMRCDSSGANCVDIATSSQSSYFNVYFEDVGVTYRVRVTATNVDGTATVTSDPSAVVPEPPPASTGYPWVYWQLTEGETFVAAMGTWRSVSPVSVSRAEFMTCPTGSNPPAATCTLLADSASTSIVIPASAVDQRLFWRLHVTNAVATTATYWRSADQLIRPAPPTLLAAPTLSGSATEGSTLTATAGTWSASFPVVVVRQWLSCLPDGTGCAQVPASGMSYVVRPQDEYRTIRVREYAVADAINDSAQAIALSDPTAVVPLQAPHVNPTGNFNLYGQDPMRVGVIISGHHNQAYQWSSPAAFSTSLQWLRCDAAGANCAAIAGATLQSYTPTVADIGFTLRLRHEATNAAGTATRDTVASVVVTPYPPQSSSPYPRITGTLVEGSTLSATSGTFTSPTTHSVALQWQLCPATTGTCTDVAGATGATLGLTAAHIGEYVNIRVTATNEGGSTVVSGWRQGPVRPLAPVATGAPSISGGSESGTTATAVGGTFSASTAVTVTYTWESCDATGADCNYLRIAPTYDVPVELVGRRLRVSAHGANGGGTTTISSAPGPVIVGPPRWMQQPYVHGSPKVDGELTISMQALGTAPLAVERTWYRCNLDGTGCSITPERTGTSAIMVAADIGRSIRVRVRVSNAHGSIAADSNLIEVVGQQPALQSWSTVTGTPVVGQVLRWGGATWRDSTWTSLRWQRCAINGTECVEISGATSREYVVAAADEGRWLVVVEQAGNAAGTASTRSAPVGPIRVDAVLIPVVEPRVAPVALNAWQVVRWAPPVPAADGVVSTVRVWTRRAFSWQRPGVARVELAYSGAASRTQLRVAAGETVCVMLSVVRGGEEGARSPLRCVTGIAKASSLGVRGRWSRLGTARSSSTHGATISTTARRKVTGVSVRLRMCGSCGRVAVMWRGMVVRRINLRGPKRTVTYAMPTLRNPGAGTLSVRVEGSRRSVTIEGIALHLGL